MARDCCGNYVDDDDYYGSGRGAFPAAKPTFHQATMDVVDTAVEYIKLRDSLNSHRSPEGKKLNDAVKAYLAALK